MGIMTEFTDLREGRERAERARERVSVEEKESGSVEEREVVRKWKCSSLVRCERGS